MRLTKKDNENIVSHTQINGEKKKAKEIMIGEKTSGANRAAESADDDDEDQDHPTINRPCRADRCLRIQDIQCSHHHGDHRDSQGYTQSTTQYTLDGGAMTTTSSLGGCLALRLCLLLSEREKKGRCAT